MVDVASVAHFQFYEHPSNNRDSSFDWDNTTIEGLKPLQCFIQQVYIDNNLFYFIIFLCERRGTSVDLNFQQPRIVIVTQEVSII